MLAKDNINTIEFLISKDLIDSCISHDEFDSVNNVMKEYDDKRESIENLKIFNSDNEYA